MSVSARAYPLTLVPVTLAEAHAFVARVHRHHKPSRGGRFAIGAARNNAIIGVAVVGRPVARGSQDTWTAEVTRLAVEEGQRNACSFLYAACWRACRAMGFRRLITYTLASEPGTSLRAAGWKEIGLRGGGSWNCESRPRVDAHPLEQKRLWEAA